MYTYLEIYLYVKHQKAGASSDIIQDYSCFQACGSPTPWPMHCNPKQQHLDPLYFTTYNLSSIHPRVTSSQLQLHNQPIQPNHHSCAINHSIPTSHSLLKITT